MGGGDEGGGGYGCCLVMKKYLIITCADVSMRGHMVKKASLVGVAF